MVQAGSLKSFVSENTVKVNQPLEADLRVEDGMIVGKLRNRSGESLQDVALVRGDGVQYIGYMPGGGSADIKLRLSSRPFDNSTPVGLLPTPPGVNAPNVGASYPGFGGNSSEQRLYNRRLSLLNLGVGSLLRNESPADMSVLAIAWGPGVPVNVDVSANTARPNQMNVWTTRLQVGSGNNQALEMPAGSVPAWTYVPEGDPAWTSGTPSNAMTIQSYADVNFSLPVGSKPQSITLRAASGSPQAPVGGVPGPVPTQDLAAPTPAPTPTATSNAPQEMRVSVYNVQTGRWDSITGTGDGIEIPDPASYIGRAGDVTVRVPPSVFLDIVVSGKP
jgi:hypothetical protein